MQDYHQLDIWNRAMDYAVKIYEFVAALPHRGKIQSRRSTSARRRFGAPLNIAEGAGSATNAEFGRFLSYAYRSLKEIITALELSHRLYPSLPQPISEVDQGNQISRMTYNLIQKVAPDMGLRWGS